MKKKFFALIVICLTISVICPLAAAYAETADPTVNAKAAYLIDGNSGTVLFSKNENDRMTIASMTKIMLLDLCFEKIDEKELSFDEQIKISKTASGMGGSQVFLEAGRTYKCDDLIKSIIVSSANDASVAMAERLFGSESACVEAMNAKCNDWNLENTLFSNCTGLPKPTQYSCAKDVAKMLTELIKHKEYFRFSNIWTDEISHGDHVTGLTNTNKLIRFYEGCDGGKTGYTSESGFCIAATAKRGAMRLVSVVINSPDSKKRFADASNLFNYGFDNYTDRMVVDSSRPIDIEVDVKKGLKDTVSVRPEKDLFVFSARNVKNNITVDFEPANIKAPVKKGDKIGQLIVYKDNVEYARVNVVSEQDVDRKTFFHYIKDISDGWTF